MRGRAILGGCRGHYAEDVLDEWVHRPMPAGFSARIARHYYLIAEAGGRAVGFAALKRIAHEVDAVFVVPQVFGTGLGAKLLGRIEARARATGLRLLTLNASLNAVPFYRRAGYRALRPAVHVSATGLRIPCVRMRKALRRG